MSEWISVKDRLPTEGVLVLAYDPGKPMRTDYIVDMEAWEPKYIWARVLSVDEYTKTTHWMPLPSPPRSEL